MDSDAIVSGVNKFFSLPLTLLMTFGLASAQTAQDIVNKVDAAQKTLKDISFRMSGTASMDSSTQKIDFTVKSIPAQNVARIQFAAPDALADNIVVADKNEVRQYMYLTNQITVTPIKKAASNMGLTGIDFTNVGNASNLLAQYDVKLVGTSGTAGKRLFQLEATPKTGSSTDLTRLWITEDGWRPTRIQVVSSAGKSLADLNVTNYKTNTGLTVAKLRDLPKDAEVIKQ